MSGLAIILGIVALYAIGGWLVESYRHDLTDAKYRALLTEFEAEGH